MTRIGLIHRNARLSAGLFQVIHCLTRPETFSTKMEGMVTNSEGVRIDDDQLQDQAMQMSYALCIENRPIHPLSIPSYWT